MFKATKYLLAKPRVRPVLNNAVKPNTPKRTRMQVTPAGLAFLVGSVVFGLYLFKPTTSRMPTAALDTFKPQIAIVFGSGDSNNSFKQAAQKLGFDYVNVQKDMAEFDRLVKSGKTKFFIEGFKSPEQLADMAQNTVQPDIVIEFGKPVSGRNSREVYVPQPSVESISKILSKQNLI